MDGISLNEQNAFELLALISSYTSEYEPIFENNGFESAGDGAAYYGMIRVLKPRMLIEIGAGHSTKVAVSALEKNFRENGIPYCLTVIEPYPKKVLLQLAESNPNICLIVEKIENVSQQQFENLDENSILFIDTSHNIQTGNDVYHLYLKILPAVNKGVNIHIHDIFIPYDYPRRWVESERKIWSEQYLLQTFLAHNSEFEVLLPLHHLYKLDKERVSNKLTGLTINDPIGPSSFWLKRK